MYHCNLLVQLSVLFILVRFHSDLDLCGTLQGTAQFICCVCHRVVSPHRASCFTAIVSQQGLSSKKFHCVDLNSICLHQIWIYLIADLSRSLLWYRWLPCAAEWHFAICISICIRSTFIVSSSFPHLVHRACLSRQVFGSFQLH